MANPTLTFKYLFKLSYYHSGYYYQTTGTSLGSYTVQDDLSDSGSDDATQLGEISNDQFHATGSSSNIQLTYVGQTVAHHAGPPGPTGVDLPGGSVLAVAGNGQMYELSNNPDYVGNATTFYDYDTTTPFSLLCFASGTAIRTPRGDVAVEDLNVGENVITASGEQRPIKWIGYRRTDCVNHPRPKDVWPVRVEAGALGNNTPSRALYLTPYHAVAMTCGKDVLVPIHSLINGTTIRQVEVDEITYWHVELETHDILIANGALAESYLDTGNRSGFENADDAMELHPRFEAGRTGDFCLEMIESGPVIAAIRASLPTRAAEGSPTIRARTAIAA